VQEVDRIWCDSKYNLITLFENANETYMSKSIVLPIVREYKRNFSESLSRKYIISIIGRWSCNKKIEDAIFLLHYLKKINPKYRLQIIGKRIPAFSKYTEFILDRIESLSLQDSVVILDDISEKEKNERLVDSDFLISMSEHEGFCIPILESIFLNIPVFAYDTPAVKENLNDSGILFKEKKFQFLAELFDYTNHSEKIINTLKQKMKTRIEKIRSINFYNIIKQELSLNESIL